MSQNSSKVDDSVTISKGRYADLLIAEEEIARLDAGGVDNWEGYSESLNPEGEESYGDMTDRIRKELGLA